MNNRKFSILALGILLFAASCKKNDVAAPAVAASTSTEATVSASTWKPATNWTSSKEDKYTTYSATITDNNVTSDIADNGMVLVYVKSGNTVNSLPFQGTGANDTYWYYQVSENTIQINADAYQESQNMGKDVSFSYFVLSAAKLQDLESKGTSRGALMSLTYENAATLLK